MHFDMEENMGCRSGGVWNAKHGYRFGTQKFENRRTTYKTLNVFGGNGSAKRDRGSTKIF